MPKGLKGFQKGHGYLLSEAAKKVVADKLRGRTLGPMSDETKKKLSVSIRLAKKGIRPWNYKELSKEILVELYIIQKLSTIEIGQRLNCYATTVQDYLRKYDIPIRSVGVQAGQKPWNKGIEYPQMKKENHWNWKGGVTPIHTMIRNSKQGKEWRIAVFKRDNYTCQNCFKRGGILNADHIKPFSRYPELRFDVNNGRTLCVDCHKQTATYGFKLVTN